MHDPKRREKLLLDLHLDQLDEDERVWIEAELLRDPALCAKSDRLGHVLQPLDHWTTPPAPANLPDRILAHIEEYKQQQGQPVPLQLVGAQTPGQVNEGRYERGWSFSMKELLAVAACILLLFSVMMPSLSRARSVSRREVCGSHLGSIGRGLGMYQQMSSGSLPFAGTVPGASWLPYGPKERPRTSNSRHVYLLVRSRLVPGSEVFVCPASRSSRPMNAEQLDRFSDFPSADNISYDTLNMTGERPPVNPVFPIAYISDRNPLFVGGRFNETVDPDSTNSPIHDEGAGQNVLMLDGSVLWLTSPLLGPKLDNIWLAGSIRRYEGTEAQTSAEDAFMVPGFPTNETDRTAKDEP